MHCHRLHTLRFFPARWVRSVCSGGWISLCLLVCLAGSATGRDLGQTLDAEYRDGRIDYPTYLVRRAYMLYAPERLATLYPNDRIGHAARCGTALLMELYAARDLISPADQAFIDGLLKPAIRPPTQFEFITNSNNFKVHYDATGFARLPSEDLDGNSIPDYADLTAALLDSIHAVFTEQMGWRTMPSDDGVEGPQFDVYLLNLQGREYGRTDILDVFLVMDNDFRESAYYTKGRDALRVTIAHELHHAIQFAYAPPNRDLWFYEAMSTYMEDLFFPDINDWYQYLIRFFPNKMFIPFDDPPNPQLHAYALAMYCIYLQEKFEQPTVFPRIWEQYEGERPRIMSNAIDHVLQEERSSFVESLVEFHDWIYYTNDRAAPSVSFSEGADYFIRNLGTRDRDTSYTTSILPDTFEVFASDTLEILKPKLTPHYLRIFGRAPGTYTLSVETDGFNDYDLTWEVHVLLDDATSPNYSRRLTRRSAFTADLTLDYLDQFPAFTIQATVIDQDENKDPNGGKEFPLRIYLTTGVVAKVANILETPFPSPFIANGTDEATFRYILTEESPVELFVLNTSGQEMWGAHQGIQPAGLRFAHWNGRDNSGKIVPSGIYIAMLKTRSGQVLQKMAVIRE